ncbi:MAG: hypothetical protein KDK39_20300, partial [Leptospiraceae bacterium]|nr:hypothetical protein [Leptospiraceae bacterium]
FPPHASLRIGDAHFERWVLLFNQTLDEHFHGQKTEEARWRAQKMAALFASKIEYYRQADARPLI